MNEVVPDWATNPRDPNAIIHCEDVDAEWIRKAYKEEIDRLCEENNRLRNENAELREKCKTNFERLKEVTAREASYALGHLFKSMSPNEILTWLESNRDFDTTWYGVRENYDRS